MRPWLIAFAAAALAADSPTNGKRPVAPPKGAVVLFDGKNLDAWQPVFPDDKHFGIVDGTLRVLTEAPPHRGCRIATRQDFGDVKLHVEFWVPLMADQKGQARGNSGVFLQGRYEVQILDTFGHPPEIDGAGALYKVAAPRVNASLAPENWQSYDIEYRAARFDGDSVVAKPRITVVQNGVKIHDNVELSTPGTPANAAKDFARTGPILLQNHRCAVRFRNIWLVPLK